MEWRRVDGETKMAGSPMSDRDEEDHPAWKRLKAMHDRGDFDKIEKMVSIYDGVEALGSIGSIAGRALIWCTSIIAAYLAVTGHLADWIRSIR